MADIILLTVISMLYLIAIGYVQDDIENKNK